MEQLTTGRISLRRTGTYAGAPVAGFVTALHKDAIMARDHGKMMRPWAETCQDGPNGVARLRKDWLAFLDAWNRRTISENRRGFAEAADHLLGRLRERIQTETWAFSATGLQSGAISLR